MTKLISYFAVFMIVLLGMVANGAEAQVQCGLHSKIIVALGLRYDEAMKHTGTINSEISMEIYVASNGSWTMLSVSTNGRSCILAAGKNFEDVPWEPGRKS